MKRLLCGLILFLAITGYSQLSVQLTNTPLTAIEAAAGAKGITVVKGISDVGSLAGQITFPIEVRVQQVIHVETARKFYGVMIRTKMPNQTVVNYIDYDELESLLSGIHYIVQAEHNITPLEHFNAYFQTRGGFTVSKYSVDNRNYTALKTGIPESEPNVLDLPAVNEFETLMVAAKTKLDALKHADR